MSVQLRHRPSEWRRAIYRFRKNQLSLVGLSVIVAIVLMGVFAPYVAPYPEDVRAIHFSERFLPPSQAHPFGTDDAGRDILSRVIFGVRIDLVAAMFAQSIVLLIGVPLGMIAGYTGGRIGALIMAVSDVFITIPPLILALAAISMLRPSLEIAIFSVSLAWWPWYARVIEAVVVHIKEEKFVEAGRMVGKGSLKIVFQDIFPNAFSIIVVKATFDLAFVMLFISALGFLGVGAQAPTPSWGNMIGEARVHLPDVWWTSTFPGIFIFLTVLGFNLFGEGLRDAFDIRYQ